MNFNSRLPSRRRLGIYLSVLAVSTASAAWGSGDTQSPYEKRFHEETDAAMAMMMNAMDAAPSGDVDRDFAVMMIPHHQGAIDMARSELRYGRNEQLRRIAQEIVVDQAQEIVVMRTELGRFSDRADEHPMHPPRPGQPMPATQIMKGAM